MSNEKHDFSLQITFFDIVTTAPDCSLNDLRVATSLDGILTWIHSDHLHSATILTDAAGAELRHLAYRAFGEEAENIGSGSEPKYSYTGKSLTAPA